MAVGKNHIKYVKSPNCLLPGPVLPCNCCFLETRIIFFFRQYSHIVDNKPACNEFNIEEKIKYRIPANPKMRRGISSNGRARALHARGSGIDARILQQNFLSGDMLTLKVVRKSRCIIGKIKYIKSPRLFVASLDSFIVQFFKTILENLLII